MTIGERGANLHLGLLDRNVPPVLEGELPRPDSVFGVELFHSMKDEEPETDYTVFYDYGAFSLGDGQLFLYFNVTDANEYKPKRILFKFEEENPISHIGYALADYIDPELKRNELYWGSVQAAHKLYTIEKDLFD